MQRLRAATLLVAAFLFWPSAAQSASETQAPGARMGPFVVSDKSLSNLVQNGYEIRGNLGNALVLQKGASIFSCQILPDPEKLSYKPYFLCSELHEEFPRASDKTKAPLRKQQGN